jgi:predicted Zn-dependent peptidase
LSTNILGTRTSVTNTKREDFVTFVKEHLIGDEIIVSAVGPVDTKKVTAAFNKKLEDLNFTGKKLNRKKPLALQPFDLEEKKQINQVHCMLGFEGFPLAHEERITLFMLVHYLGGSQMSSLLNMELREKRGLVYTVECGYTTYSDTGLVSIYFGCDPTNFKQCLSLVKKQLKKLTQSKVSSLALKRMKGQLIAQLAMAEENNQSLVQVAARSLLDLGYIQDLDEIIEKVKAVDPEKLKQVSEEIFDLEKVGEMVKED